MWYSFQQSNLSHSINIINAPKGQTSNYRASSHGTGWVLEVGLGSWQATHSTPTVQYRKYALYVRHVQYWTSRCRILSRWSKFYRKEAAYGPMVGKDFAGDFGGIFAGE